MSRTVNIGTYSLGSMSVHVVANGGLGGGFHFEPDGTWTLTVGCGSDGAKTLAALLHEAIEMVKAERGLRYGPCPDFACSSANYLFVATHEQFAEVIAAVAEFVMPVIPKLATAHAKLHREATL